MHEVGLMQNALDIALKNANANGAISIEKIHMKIGALSGVEPDALSFAFEILKEDTIAANAELVVEYIPLRMHCSQCNLDFEPVNNESICPQCHDPVWETVSGRELHVSRIEFNGEDD